MPAEGSRPACDNALPTVAEVLMDPAMSAPLKAVILTWAARDAVDAAADARLLADLFERRADEALSWVR